VYATSSLAILDSLDAYPERILLLGGAALTLPVAFEARDADVRTDVVEIDREVTALASEFFAYGEAERPGIRVVHGDARVWLRGSDARYDLVYLDVFDHLLTVPWTMVTEEALTQMADALPPSGIFMVNVLSPLEGPGTAFLERFATTLEAVFGDVRLYLTDASTDPGATQNLIVVATREPGVLPDLPWTEAPITPSGRPLTDDWAPVEYLQAKVFAQGLRWR
jgi:spermidine synthase